jgi:tetratricopeptide (TPR) repeat protein
MTERDQTSDADDRETKPEADLDVHNTVSAQTMTGVVIQAGTIGVIHQHLPPHRVPTPRQLPPAPPQFVGRLTELTELTAVLLTTAERRITLVITALAGAGGVGKSALAVHWAYANQHRYPDGQLFVDLQGFSPAEAPVEPAAAVRGFLDALGVAPDRIPADFHAQVGLYRSLIAGKRMLIVLDNAASVEQVVPLLPGGATCTVIVTSRHRLAGLTVTYGTRLLDLDVLPTADAQDLLARYLGAERLAAEPGAVADLLAVCAGLPLAVRIVAARAEYHRDFPLAVLAEELRDTAARLVGLDAGDVHSNLRVVLSWSARALSPQAATMFELLGIAPGPDISLSAAASLAAASEGQARMVLRELEDASLVQQHTPGRYRMHDLIRLYATDTARQDVAQDAREAALRRVLDFYIHTAHAAVRLLYPHAQLIQLDPPAVGMHPQPLPDAPAVMAWFAAENPALMAAQHTAASHDRHSAVWQLAWAMDTVHRRQGHHHARLTVWQAALDAAVHLPDPTFRIAGHRILGYAHAALGRHEEGVGHLHQALALAEDHHDTDQQVHTHEALAGAWELRGDDRQALTHATRARDLLHAVDQPVWEADALGDMGWYAARLGEYDTARAHCQAALALHRDHDNPAGQAATLDSLGYIAHHTGCRHQAIDYYQQALTLYGTLGNATEAADTLDRLGHPHLALGERERARAVWQEALKLYQQQGRDEDTARVQRQLDDLDKRSGAARPYE